MDISADCSQLVGVPKFNAVKNFVHEQLTGLVSQHLLVEEADRGLLAVEMARPVAENVGKGDKIAGIEEETRQLRQVILQLQFGFLRDPVLQHVENNRATLFFQR